MKPFEGSTEAEHTWWAKQRDVDRNCKGRLLAAFCFQWICRKQKTKERLGGWRSLSGGVCCFVSGILMIMDECSKEGGQSESNKQIRSRKSENHDGFGHNDAPPIAESVPDS